MPLSLGGVSTERRQLIVFNPEIYAEAKEAETKAEALVRNGFVLREKKEGEIVLDPPEKDPNHGVFRILSPNGDDRVIWDRREPSQVREAFKKFKELKDKGYTAYAAKSDGKKGHRIDAFDPGLEEIIMVPKTMPG